MPKCKEEKIIKQGSLEVYFPRERNPLGTYIGVMVMCMYPGHFVSLGVWLYVLYGKQKASIVMAGVKQGSATAHRSAHLQAPGLVTHLFYHCNDTIFIK